MKKFILPLALLSLFSIGAQADSIDSKFNVNMNILEACKVDAPPPANFGDVFPFSTDNVAKTDLTVQCSKGTPYTILLVNLHAPWGNTSGQMTSVDGGEDIVIFEMFQDIARTKPWGHGQDTAKTAVATGEAQVHPVYLYNEDANLKPGVYEGVTNVYVQY